MAASILYPVNPATKTAAPFKLQLIGSRGYLSSGVSVTQHAFNLAEFCRVVLEVNEDGILTNQGSVAFPHIYIRVNKKHGPTTILTLVSEKELRQLSEHFQLPSDILAGAFFRRTEKFGATHPNSITMKINWSELVDPEWKAAFLAWIAETSVLPSPSVFDWQTLYPGLINFPGLRQMLCFNSHIEGPIRGEFKLKEIGGQRFAYFHYGKNRAAEFRLYSERIEKGTNTITHEGDFVKSSFTALLGSSPSSLIYSFNRATDNRGEISFGNISGATLVIESSESVSLQPGKMYQVKVERNNLLLTFQVFKDPTDKAPFGVATVGLFEGYPSRNRIKLVRP